MHLFRQTRATATETCRFLRNNFYLRAVVSDNDVYAGEELTVTYYIYINARSSITDYRLNGATRFRLSTVFMQIY